MKAKGQWQKQTEKLWNGFEKLYGNWTLFDSGLTAGKVKQAVEGYKKAQEQLKQTVDSVQLDVRSTYLSLKSAEQSIATSSSAVGLAEEDYKIKVTRYQAGVGTNLDVLDAQVALTTAKNNYLQAMYNKKSLLLMRDRKLRMIRRNFQLTAKDKRPINRILYMYYMY